MILIYFLIFRDTIKFYLYSENNNSVNTKARNDIDIGSSFMTLMKNNQCPLICPSLFVACNHFPNKIKYCTNASEMGYEGISAACEKYGQCDT